MTSMLSRPAAAALAAAGFATGLLCVIDPAWAWTGAVIGAATVGIDYELRRAPAQPSRWTARRYKAIVGELAEWPLSTADDIAETLRYSPHRIEADLQALEAQRRAVRQTLDIPNPFGRTVPTELWVRPDLDTELAQLTTDQHTETDRP